MAKKKAAVVAASVPPEAPTFPKDHLHDLMLVVHRVASLERALPWEEIKASSQETRMEWEWILVFTDYFMDYFPDVLEEATGKPLQVKDVHRSVVDIYTARRKAQQALGELAYLYANFLIFHPREWHYFFNNPTVELLLS